MAAIITTIDQRQRDSLVKFEKKSEGKKKGNKRPSGRVESSISVIVYPSRPCQSASGGLTTQLHGTAQQRGGILLNNNTHTHNTHFIRISHETCIGGDLDTDPALRFRIGGSS